MTKTILLEVAKWLCVAAVAAMLIVMLSSNRESHTDFAKMSETVSAAADLDIMAQGGNQTLKRLYGLEAADYEGFLLYYPTSNMGAEELLVIKLSDKSQQQQVSEAIAKRLKTQMDSFDGYGIDQYAMLENSVVEVQGNYVLFVSAQDPAAVQKAFLDAL